MWIDKKTLLDAIRSIAPEELMEPWDNTGIQIDTGKERIHKILVCLDVNGETIQEAVEQNCDFIVSHHPLFFHSVKAIRAESYPGEYAITLIKHDISVYSSHTSFDTAEGGNNDYLACLFGLEQVEIPAEEPILRTGFFRKPVPMRNVCDFVAEKLGHSYPIPYAGDENKIIHKVAICSGAGGSLLDAAKKLGCDLLITGDLKYHDALHAKEIQMNVIDGGHFETEIFFVENMGRQLQKQLGGRGEIIFSKAQKNALKTLCLPCYNGLPEKEERSD